jgi:hypothetical protein
MAQLLSIIPNPFDETTTFSIVANQNLKGKIATIIVTDLTGKQIEKTKIQLTEGINEIMFEPKQSKGKMYIATLLVDDKIIETAKVYFR